MSPTWQPEAAPPGRVKRKLPDPAAAIIAGCGFIWAASFVFIGAADHHPWLIYTGGMFAILAAVALAAFWNIPTVPAGGHAALMQQLGPPVPELPRKWGAEDWAELDEELNKR